MDPKLRKQFEESFGFVPQGGLNQPLETHIVALQIEAAKKEVEEKTDEHARRHQKGMLAEKAEEAIELLDSAREAEKAEEAARSKYEVLLDLARRAGLGRTY